MTILGTETHFEVSLCMINLKNPKLFIENLENT